VRSDVEALAGMVRGSASPGERRSAGWVAQRLTEAGAADVVQEPFRYQATYAWAHAAHVAAGIAAARAGGVLGAAGAAAVLASFELEASGRRQWLRRVLPAGEGVNVCARIPAAAERRATLVVLAHHDAARTGVSWHPALTRLATSRSAHRMAPRAGLVGVGLALAALPGRAPRAAARALLWTALISYLDVATSRTVPGANDNATGVAAMIALTRALSQRPLEHVEVRLVAPGCEEAGMGGTAAWLSAHGGDLPAETTLVLGLDTLGSGTPIVCESEATLLPHRYGEQDLALVEAAARRAELPRPQRWRVGAWTDPVLARFRGIRAVSLLSVDADGGYANWHRMTDTADRVDWASVESCIRLAAATAEEVEVRAAGRG